MDGAYSVERYTLDEVTIARAALAAAHGVAGVAGISRGRYAIARTIGLGGTVVEGVQVTPSTAGVEVEVHIVAEFVPIPALATAVRDAVAAAVRRLDTPISTVDVWVDGLRMPEPEGGRE
jgi:uncharacterized alkaline shock family protein YloU